MIATIAVIAAKKSLAIAAIIRKPLSSDRSDNDRWDKKKVLSQWSLSLRSPESGFHMIAMIAAIAELFFFSAITASDRSDHMETRL